MSKTIAFITVILFFLVVGACSTVGRIGTGEVGVRTTFNKEIKMEEQGQGFYFAVFETVTKFNVKETTIYMNDLKPRAADNLYLDELDVQIRYNILPSMVAEQIATVAGQTLVNDDGERFPNFNLVKSNAKGVINDVIDKYPSLKVQSNRPEIEAAIRNNLQTEMDKVAKGVYTINSVIISTVVPDKTLEASIQKAVEMEKLVEAKQNELELAKAAAAIQIVNADAQAEANKTLAASLSSQLLQWEQLKVQAQFAGQGTHTVLIPQGTSPQVLISK